MTSRPPPATPAAKLQIFCPDAASMANAVAALVADIDGRSGGVDGRGGALHRAGFGEGPFQLALLRDGVELSGGLRAVVDVARHGVHGEHVVAAGVGRRHVAPLLIARCDVEGVEGREFVEGDDVDGLSVGREHRAGALESVVVRAVLCPVGVEDDVFADLDFEGPRAGVAVDRGAQLHGLRADRAQPVFHDGSLLHDIAREGPLDIGGRRVVFGVEREGDRLVLGRLVAVEDVGDRQRRHRLGGGRLRSALFVVGRQREVVVLVVGQPFELHARRVLVERLLFDIVGRVLVVVGERVGEYRRRGLGPREAHERIARIDRQVGDREARRGGPADHGDVVRDEFSVDRLHVEGVLRAVDESVDRAVHLAVRAQGDRFRIGVGVVDDEVRRIPAFGQAPGELHLLVARSGGEIGDLAAGRSGFGNILTPACGETRGDERCQQKVDYYLFHACSDLSGWLIETGILPQNRRVVHDFDLALRDREDQVVRVERVAHSAEIVDGQPQPHEVEPAVAFEGEFAAPFSRPARGGTPPGF